MNVTPEQIAALTDRHRILVKHRDAPEHIKPVELELWVDNEGHLRDSVGAAIRWRSGNPALSSFDIILEIIEPPHEFKYGDVIGHPKDDGKRAAYLPNGQDELVWLTYTGWAAHEWALERLEDGWVLNPDRQDKGD